MCPIRLFRGATWLGAGLLLALALHPRHPALLFLRPVETGLLICAAMTGLAAWFFIDRKARGSGCRCREAAALCALLSVSGGLALWNEARFGIQKKRVLAAGPEVRRLGAHFIVGYTETAEAMALAERGLIGGIYLARHNVRGRSVESVRGEIDAFQAARARGGLPPLVVAADQEGGPVNHLSPLLPALPALASIPDSGSAGHVEALATAYGMQQGRSLATVGVNLNLGPVVDLRPVDGGPSFDAHTRIATRSIGTEPGHVTRIARAYSTGLAQAGVGATLKHFPGLRYASADTHHFPARIDRSLDELEADDWLPFRKAWIPGSAIMLGHVVVPGLDPEHPASLSPTVVRDLLRHTWKYEGPLITDDLVMGAVYRRGICTATLQALRAGVDLLLIAYDPDQYFRAIDCAATALKRKGLDEGSLQQSRQRIGQMFRRAPPSARLAPAEVRSAPFAVAPGSRFPP